MENKRDYYVYMIRCKDESLYTGITTDVERRYREPLQEEADDWTEEESGESEETEPEESFCGMVNRLAAVACIQYPAATIIFLALFNAILAKIIS